VDLDGSVEDDVVRGLIWDSYDLVVAGLPLSVRAELPRTVGGGGKTQVQPVGTSGPRDPTVGLCHGRRPDTFVTPESAPHLRCPVVESAVKSATGHRATSERRRTRA
jgi:hypothetical protein